MNRLTDDSYARLHQSMLGFGYRVSLAFVTEETNHILDGSRPSNVIGLFLESQLSKAGLLPKKREATKSIDVPNVQSSGLER